MTGTPELLSRFVRINLMTGATLLVPHTTLVIFSS